MEKVNLKILDYEDKKTKAGARYTRFQTDQGWMSCFDKKVCETLKELDKESEVLLELAISEDEKFRNIRGIAQKGSGESQPAEKKSSVEAGNSKNATMYASYAKDVFLGILEKEPGNRVYEDIMKTAVELVKQAKKEFE